METLIAGGVPRLSATRSQICRISRAQPLPLPPSRPHPSLLCVLVIISLNFSATMAAFVGILSSSLVLLGLAVVLLVFLVVRAIVRYRKLSQFRGPFWASISRSYIFWKSIHRSLWIAECAALEKYGSRTLELSLSLSFA